MSLSELARRHLGDHRHLSFAVVAPRENLAVLEPSPLGIPCQQLPTEDHPDLPEQYLAANQLAFGKLSLPRWVLSDLYLLPSCLGVFLCAAEHVRPDLRAHLGVEAGARVIGAAYVAAPSLRAGAFVGVSLLSFLKEGGSAAWIKTLTLKLVGAREVRGIAQWDNPSLRVHTRLGPLRLVGRVPGGHEYADRTFVYSHELGDDAAWAWWMSRSRTEAPTDRVPAGDVRALGALLDRACAGERVRIVPPGLEDGRVLIRVG